MKETKRSACPTCGEVATRDIYDIGSGPELCCASCEWCWGAEGQLLKPLAYADVVRQLGFDPMTSDVALARAEAVSETESE